MGLSMGSFVHVNKSHIFGQIADPRKQAEAGLERGWRLWQGGGLWTIMGRRVGPYIPVFASRRIFSEQVDYKFP